MDRPIPCVPAVTNILLSANDISMTSLLGGALVEPLFGMILDMNGQQPSDDAYYYGMLILPVTFILGLVMSYLIRETRCKHLEQ